MRTKLTAPLRNVLGFERRRPSDVHFHTDAAGRPFVCDLGRCDSARLSVRDLGTIR